MRVLQCNVVPKPAFQSLHNAISRLTFLQRQGQSEADHHKGSNYPDAEIAIFFSTAFRHKFCFSFPVYGGKQKDEKETDSPIKKVVFKRELN
jgi:hypothetical protein